MLKNDKGFSIVELLAVIIITSFILVPLMTTFTNNITLYDRFEKRRSVVGIIDVMVNSIDRLNFNEVLIELNNSPDHYYVMSSSDCSSFTAPNDQTFCNNFFNLTYNNYTLTEENLEIYFFDWNISEAEMTVLEAEGFHPEINRQLSEIITNDFPESVSVMRFMIIGHYDTGDNDVVVIGGVMASD
jgi:type II secretory pathway pseudopilin PulG